MCKTIWLSLLLLPLVLLTTAASGATPVAATAALGAEKIAEKVAEKVAEKASSPVAADYHGRHYLWVDNTFNAATYTEGTIELRADGGTYFANNYQAEFSWTLSEDQTLDLQFDHFVENVGFEFINGAQVEVRFVLTSIQLQRTFTETDDSQQLHFSILRTGYKRYQGGSLPDVPYPSFPYPLKSTRTAGLLAPAPFIETGITALMPAVTTEVDTLVYDPILSWPNITYSRSAQRLRFDTVMGSSGTATLIKAKLQQDGTSIEQNQTVSWQINADQTVTLLEQDGSQYQLAFLALSQANHPVLQVRYIPADPAKSAQIMQQAYWVKKNTPMSLSQLLANPVLELYQSAESRFWFEFHANGFGLQVSASDQNNDQQFSDNEISQEPFRWQLLNGVLEFHRYSFSSLSGKSGVCLPTTFNPAATSECISRSVRRYNVFDITPFNGIATAAIYNEQMLLATVRQAHWPATNILQAPSAIDVRFLQMTASRPFPIKPLVAGVAIADDVLRQCILQHNPAIPAALTTLNCTGDVHQLTGLEKFTNLRSVTIKGSNRLSINGLARLKQLPSLTHLELSNLLIGDTEFATLAGMSPNSPLRLLLNATGLSDASYDVLDTMNISSIYLGGPLTLMPVSRLPNDVTLAKLGGLHLTNLRLPTLLPELARLKNLPNIEYLGFVNMNMGSLNHIQLPPNINSLMFAEDNVDSLDATKLNPALLSDFHIYDANIQSVAFIDGLPNLEFLTLRRVTLTDWSPLTKPVPISLLNAQFNSHVPCTVYNAIKTANPAMNVQYDACSSTTTHHYELNLPGGITATAISFNDANDASKGTLRIVAGKLEFIPAAGISGWIEFTVMVTLSNGSTKSFSFRTYINKKSTRNKGLPWWVISAPNPG